MVARRHYGYDADNCDTNIIAEAITVDVSIKTLAVVCVIYSIPIRYVVEIHASDGRLRHNLP